MLKQEARNIFKQKRSELSTAEVDILSLRIGQNLFSSGLIKTDLNIHCFLSIEEKREVRTTTIIEKIWDEFPWSNVIASRSDFQTKTMTHFAITSEIELETSQYGIPEPIGGPTISEDELDIVLIPLLAFDKHGDRVGYGKGFYDKFLSRCKPNTKFAGLSLFNPVDKIDDINDLDIRLTHCITPTEIHTF